MKKITLGIDIDGVIANQITTLLPIINKKYNLNMSYADIDHWRKPIADTDIAVLIVEAQRNDNFILNIQLLPNAKKIINELSKKYAIYLLTARELCTKDATQKWLEKNGVKYDKFYNLREGNKQEIEVDIIIDDYKGNIENYLNSHISSKAILFKQPWNSPDEVKYFIDIDRCRVAYGWNEIPDLINKLLK